MSEVIEFEMKIDEEKIKKRAFFSIFYGLH